MPELVQLLQNLIASINATHNSLNNTNISPTTVPSPTPHSFDPLNSCGCANGGWCILYPEGFFACECDSDFEGRYCENLVFTLNELSNPNKGTNSSIPTTIALVLIASLIAFVAVFIVWRKCKSAQEKRDWVKWQENRRQSKTTIEGPTIVDIPVQFHQNPPSSTLKFHETQFTNPSYHVTTMEVAENSQASHSVVELNKIEPTENKTMPNEPTEKERHLPIA